MRLQSSLWEGAGAAQEDEAQTIPAGTHWWLQQSNYSREDSDFKFYGFSCCAQLLVCLIPCQGRKLQKLWGSLLAWTPVWECWKTMDLWCLSWSRFRNVSNMPCQKTKSLWFLQSPYVIFIFCTCSTNLWLHGDLKVKLTGGVHLIKFRHRQNVLFSHVTQIKYTYLLNYLLDSRRSTLWC